jgi:hypothetical protein
MHHVLQGFYQFALLPDWASSIKSSIAPVFLCSATASVWP